MPPQDRYGLRRRLGLAERQAPGLEWRRAGLMDELERRLREALAEEYAAGLRLEEEENGNS